jgi:hypothetical protein
MLDNPKVAPDDKFRRNVGIRGKKGGENPECHRYDPMLIFNKEDSRNKIHKQSVLLSVSDGVGA